MQFLYIPNNSNFVHHLCLKTPYFKGKSHKERQSFWSTNRELRAQFCAEEHSLFTSCCVMQLLKGKV